MLQGNRLIDISQYEKYYRYISDIDTGLNKSIIFAHKHENKSTMLA